MEWISSYRKNRDFNYRMRLKHELKTRIVQEVSNLGLSQIRDKDQKTYITPSYPVQTFQNSQQLRFTHNKHFKHRVSYRFRSEEEDDINRLLSKNEKYGLGFQVELTKKLSLEIQVE